MHFPALPLPHTPLEILFCACAAGAVIMGALVVLLRDPISSALALVVTLCSVAGLFLTLGAQFIAMVQVIVYAGAIMVLFLFVIMLLQIRGGSNAARGLAGPKVLGGVLGVALFVELGAAFSAASYPGLPANPQLDDPMNTQVIGRVLFSQYLLPFEAISILLLVALLGAVVLAKRKF